MNKKGNQAEITTKENETSAITAQQLENQKQRRERQNKRKKGREVKRIVVEGSVAEHRTKVSWSPGPAFERILRIDEQVVVGSTFGRTKSTTEKKKES